jgi:hypothetical protein
MWMRILKSKKVISSFLHWINRIHSTVGYITLPPPDANGCTNRSLLKSWNVFKNEDTEVKDSNNPSTNKSDSFNNEGNMGNITLPPLRMRTGARIEVSRSMYQMDKAALACTNVYAHGTDPINRKMKKIGSRIWMRCQDLLTH